MPHTSTLISQFEDIINQSSNELDNNLAKAMKMKSGHSKKQKRSKHESHEVKAVDNDADIPPPIPARAPIVRNTQEETPDGYFVPISGWSNEDEPQVIDQSDEGIEGLYTISDQIQEVNYKHGELGIS